MKRLPTKKIARTFSLRSPPSTPRFARPGRSANGDNDSDASVGGHHHIGLELARYEELKASMLRLQTELTQIRASTDRLIEIMGRQVPPRRPVIDFIVGAWRTGQLNLTGTRVEAFPGADLIVRPKPGSGHVCEMTGGDPQMILRFRGWSHLPAGRYVLRFKNMVGANQLLNPTLYPDTGRDFNEIDAVRLNITTSRFKAANTLFILPRDVKKLRVDPSIGPGQFSFDSIRLRRITLVEYYARLVSQLLRRHVRGVGDLKRSTAAAISTVREAGFSALAQRVRDAYEASTKSYQSWLEKTESLSEDAVAELAARVEQLPERPLISVVMPVYNTPEILLREALDSVRRQIYPNWELCVADDNSTLPHVKAVLREYAAADSRIKVVFRETNGHISEATNSAFELATGAWVALLDHDDLLRTNALAEVALEIAKHPTAQLIYSDEDKIDEKGHRYDPYFKPGFSRELFRSQNYFNHLTVHRAENIRSVGGWRKGYEGSQDYDLNLRIIERVETRTIRHIPKVLYHWRAVRGSTAVAGSEKSYAFDAGLRALEDHIERTRISAKAVPAPDTPFYRLQFQVPSPEPLVSLIIPTRDKLDLIKGCISSIRDKTTYANYEIIVVDNASREAGALEYLSSLEREPRVRVLSYEKPFNYSAINNFAVQSANGSILALVNNDIEVISPDWLTEMVSWAAQPDIGCVGAKLYYGNDTIQHAGVILGLGGVAGHSHKHFPRDHHGYFWRLKLLQNLSAVTAACLVVRADVFAEVGGLNERDLPVAFNDVDFCLKVRDAGYMNVWTPYAELYHLESVSRGIDDNPEKQERFRREMRYMQQSWSLDHDPYYSDNLTRASEDFAIA